MIPAGGLDQPSGGVGQSLFRHPMTAQAGRLKQCPRQAAIVVARIAVILPPLRGTSRVRNSTPLASELRRFAGARAPALKWRSKNATLQVSMSKPRAVGSRKGDKLEDGVLNLLHLDGLHEDDEPVVGGELLLGAMACLWPSNTSALSWWPSSWAVSCMSRNASIDSESWPSVSKMTASSGDSRNRSGAQPRRPRPGSRDIPYWRVSCGRRL